MGVGFQNNINKLLARVRKQMSTTIYGTDPPSCTATAVLFTFVYRVRPITDRDGDYITQQLTARYSKENRPNRVPQNVGLALLFLFSMPRRSFGSTNKRVLRRVPFFSYLATFKLRGIRCYLLPCFCVRSMHGSQPHCYR